jgi:hypothetical protein
MNEEEYKNAKKRLRSLRALSKVADNRPLVETKIKSLKRSIKEYEKQPGKKLGMLFEEVNVKKLEESLSIGALIAILGNSAIVGQLVSWFMQWVFHSYGKPTYIAFIRFLQSEFYRREWSFDDGKTKEHIQQILKEIKDGTLKLPDHLKGIRGTIVKFINDTKLGTNVVNKLITVRQYSDGLPSDKGQRDKIMGYIVFMKKHDSSYSYKDIEFELGLKQMYVERLMQDYKGPKARKVPQFSGKDANNFRREHDMPEIKGVTENRKKEKPVWYVQPGPEVLHELKLNLTRLSPVKVFQDFWSEVQDLGWGKNGRMRNRIELIWADWKKAVEQQKKYGGDSQQFEEIVKALNQRKIILDYHKQAMDKYRAWRTKGAGNDTVAGVFAFLMGVQIETSKGGYTYDQIMKMKFTPSKGGIQIVKDFIKGTDSSKTLTIGDMLKSEEGAKAFVNLQIGTSEFRQMLQTDELIENTIQLVQVTIKRIKAEQASNTHTKKQQELDAFHGPQFQNKPQGQQQPAQGQQPQQGQQQPAQGQQQRPAQQQPQDDLTSENDLA